MAHARNLITPAQAPELAAYLIDAGYEVRPGKGAHQLFQVQITGAHIAGLEIPKYWAAVCASEKGVISTPTEINDAVRSFKQAGPISKREKALGHPFSVPTFRSAELDKPVRNLFIEDLRDDIAMHALQGLLAFRGMQPFEESANAAYRYADAMIEARQK